MIWLIQNNENQRNGGRTPSANRTFIRKAFTSFYPHRTVTAFIRLPSQSRGTDCKLPTVSTRGQPTVLSSRCYEGAERILSVLSNLWRVILIVRGDTLVQGMR